MRSSMVAHAAQRIQRRPHRGRVTPEVYDSAITFLEDRRHLFSSKSAATRIINSVERALPSITVQELRTMIQRTTVAVSGTTMIGPFSRVEWMGIKSFIELRRVLDEEPPNAHRA
jgi:hypothetical protein